MISFHKVINESRGKIMDKELIKKKIKDRKIVAGVVGLGYVGLPLAVEKAKSGFRTIGFDIQSTKVDNFVKRSEEHTSELQSH